MHSLPFSYETTVGLWVGLDSVLVPSAVLSRCRISLRYGFVIYKATPARSRKPEQSGKCNPSCPPVACCRAIVEPGYRKAPATVRLGKGLGLDGTISGLVGIGIRCNRP